MRSGFSLSLSSMSSSSSTVVPKTLQNTSKDEIQNRILTRNQWQDTGTAHWQSRHAVVHLNKKKLNGQWGASRRHYNIQILDNNIIITRTSQVTQFQQQVSKQVLLMNIYRWLLCCQTTIWTNFSPNWISDFFFPVLLPEYAERTIVLLSVVWQHLNLNILRKDKTVVNLECLDNSFISGMKSPKRLPFLARIPSRKEKILRLVQDHNTV